MAGRAVPRWLIGIGVVVGAVLVCEALGWPFLVKPLQAQIAKALQRDVSFDFPDGEQGDAKARTTIRLLGRIRLHADALRIAAPSWSKDPYFVDTRGFDLALPYSAIWQATHAERIHIIRLHADQLNVMAERQKDGRSSWQMAEKAADEPSARKTEIPRFDSLIVREGLIQYKDEPLSLAVDATIHTKEGASAGSTGAASGVSAVGASSPVRSTAATAADKDAAGLIITAKGKYKKGNFDGRVTASGALPLLGGEQEPVPLLLNFSTSETSFNFAGKAANLLGVDGITGEFRFKGPSLGDISELLDVTLPSTPAFDLVGKIEQKTQLWNVLIDNAKIGQSTLQAQMQYDSRGAKPLLTGRLVGQRVLLADLAPSVGGEAASASEVQKAPAKKDPNGRALPDREFDLPSLQVMNANIAIDVQSLELGQVFAQPLRPLKAQLLLTDGLLAIKDLDAQTAGGGLRGGVTLDGREPVAKWNTDLRWTDVDMAQWLKQERKGGEPPFLTGKLNGRAVLAGAGKSTGSILGSLNGTIGTSLRDGTVSHLIVEGAGIDIAQAVGVLIRGDDSLPVSCAVADFRAEKGVLFPRAVLLDTTDSTVVVDGTISLASEKLDLRATVSPKDRTPLALRAPILVRGTFEDPKVSLELSKLAPKAGMAALLALINPIAALIPLVDMGDGNPGSGCQEFLARRAKEGAGESLRGNATPAKTTGRTPASTAATTRTR